MKAKILIAFAASMTVLGLVCISSPAGAAGVCIGNGSACSEDRDGTLYQQHCAEIEQEN